MAANLRTLFQPSYYKPEDSTQTLSLLASVVCNSMDVNLLLRNRFTVWQFNHCGNRLFDAVKLRVGGTLSESRISYCTNVTNQCSVICNTRKTCLRVLVLSNERALIVPIGGLHVQAQQDSRTCWRCSFKQIHHKSLDNREREGDNTWTWLSEVEISKIDALVDAVWTGVCLRSFVILRMHYRWNRYTLRLLLESKHALTQNLSGTVCKRASSSWADTAITPFESKPT